MSISPESVETQESPKAPGHTLGFVDTPTERETMTRALNQAGFPDEKITTFHGADGVHLLTQMMEGSLWGESAEEALKQGTEELRVGHSVVCVQVHGAEEAATVADISTQHGGHSIYHFGTLVDTRLTP